MGRCLGNLLLCRSHRRPHRHPYGSDYFLCAPEYSAGSRSPGDAGDYRIEVRRQAADSGVCTASLTRRIRRKKAIAFGCQPCGCWNQTREETAPMRPPVNCPGPVGITRRNMLQIGTIGALNLALPQVLAAGEQSASKGRSPRADSCILVFLNGGPSHLDMWDMKPDLPKELRSEFQPIATSVPGIQVCEHLPRLARLMSHCALVRSVHHDQVAHAPAVYTALTGVQSNVRAGILGAKSTDHPAIGSVISRFRPPTSRVPPYVLLPYLTAEGAGGPPQPGFLGGWLGKTHDPFLVLQGGPSPDGFNLPALVPGVGMSTERVRGRRRLLAGLNQSS